MRASLDVVKRKISEVLRLFKDELEAKFNKKIIQQQVSVDDSERSDVMSTHPIQKEFVPTVDSSVVFSSDQKYSNRNAVANHIDQFTSQ